MSSFLVIPAIDLMDGQAVRLRQGRAAEKTIFSDNPADVARRWQDAGARRIHLVDLDGAFEGRPKNLETVAQIRAAVDCELELGGGLRDAAAVDATLEAGVDFVIVGTAAVENPELLDELIGRCGPRLIVGIDAKDGVAATKGWIDRSANRRAVELARDVIDRGCPRVIYTDIATDGMMQGPNLARLEEMAALAGIDVTASGGVTQLEDLKNIQALGCVNINGAIVGRALYEGTIDLAQAVKECQDV